MTSKYIIDRNDDGYPLIIIRRADSEEPRDLLTIIVDTEQDDISISSDWDACLVTFDIIPTLIEALNQAQAIKAEFASRPKPPPEPLKPPPTPEELRCRSEEIESYLRRARQLLAEQTDPDHASSAESHPD